MKHRIEGIGIAVTLVALSLGVGACGPSDEPPRQSETSVADTTGGQALTIAFSSEPSPPRTGENAFEVVITTDDGAPVTDVDVSAEFYMAAMPAINMPEMRNRTALAHQGEGRYQGTGQVIMAGEWEVTVTAMRNGEEVGRQTLTVTAD